MSVNAFYLRYWDAFSKFDARPTIHTADIPIRKSSTEAYRKFAKRWPLSFMLVARADIGKDEISAQFFCGARGHQFLDWLDPSLSGIVALRSGTRARIHKNETDCKVELFWQNVNLADEAFWPSQFFWFRAALHELAESLGPQLEAFSGRCQ